MFGFLTSIYEMFIYVLSLRLIINELLAFSVLVPLPVPLRALTCSQVTLAQI